MLDTLGHVLETVARDHASNSQPEWALDDAAIVYASDRSGVSQLYAKPLGGVAGAVTMRLTDATTGVFWPTITRDGASLAAVRWESDGYHLGIAPLDRVLTGAHGRLRAAHERRHGRRAAARREHREGARIFAVAFAGAALLAAVDRPE